MGSPSIVVRLIGPPEADGEYVALQEDGGDEVIVHLHDYTRLYEVPGYTNTSFRSYSTVARRRSSSLGSRAR